ncbi:DUF4865 family protein [Burkholderia cenocepacia]|uniref:DUF4865 family protein n=1 Tax=Burkholderia cepacia complex TaxID=87882 RepID=UPI0016395504|nr:MULTISPECIES: DUF4865 family protein [Burkholderia cepacia complex]ELW9447911.1 DUF4865 family protein [Burkholderia cenocepacia]MBR8482230.1 DUF4865 family protein [Burkholderia cenocepacia]MDN7471551.1 DUF4865 family protein [Burkholderia orbicola]MDN7503236.1 DUF4865 family protein [Burkholderia orbicola]
MLTAYYVHRLPADYDLDIIRNRVRERGRLWDDTPDLLFKGFLLREAGRHGATENGYASFYLWRNEQAFARFVTDGRYRVVTDSFGRAPIDTQVALDARKGGASTGRFARLETIEIPADADLDAALAREIARNREAAAREGVVAAAVSLDPLRWRLTRALVTEHEPDDGGEGTVYQVLHLARPLLDTLDAGGA